MTNRRLLAAYVIWSAYALAYPLAFVYGLLTPDVIPLFVGAPLLVTAGLCALVLASHVPSFARNVGLAASAQVLLGWLLISVRTIPRKVGGALWIVGVLLPIGTTIAAFRTLARIRSDSRASAS